MTESLLKRGVPGIAQVLDGTWALRELGGLSETSYIEAGLTLANWPALEPDEAALNAGIRLTLGAGVDARFSPSAKDLAQLEAATRPFIEDLSVLASRRGRDRRSAIAQRSIPLANQQVCFPAFGHSPNDKNKGISMEIRYLPRDLESALAFIVVLFLDDARPYGRDLSRCRLDSCRRFYLIDRSASNRPNTTYCCPEHGAEQNRKDNAERQRQRRKRLNRK